MGDKELQSEGKIDKAAKGDLRDVRGDVKEAARELKK